MVRVGTLGQMMPRRVLHPRMETHRAAVTKAHAILSKRPGFKAQPPHVQFKAVQAHVRTLKGRV